MPAPLDEPTARANILLYASDKSWLYRRYGNGWTAEVRRLVREYRREQEAGAVIVMDLKGEASGK
jgi:hypothetical protein